MATNKKHPRNHHYANRRDFPDEHPDAPLSADLFVYDGKLTINRNAALAAQRSGREVKVRHQLRVIGRAVPPDEQVTDLPDNLPSD
jgi:hypothetical protein